LETTYRFGKYYTLKTNYTPETNYTLDTNLNSNQTTTFLDPRCRPTAVENLKKGGRGRWEKPEFSKGTKVQC